MATSVFIPQLWSARLLANLDKALVFANLCNRDYEGEIKSAGDTVKITKISGITVKDYAGDMDVQDVDGSDLELKIDVKKYFNFRVEDVLQVQAKPELVDAYMQDAAKTLSDVADQYIAGLYTEAGSQVGTDSSPVSVANAENAYDSLVDLGTVLTEKNVPSTGRWVVVPAWFEGMFRKDSRLIATGDANAAAARINGYIGSVAGFSVYVSNNAPKAESNFKIIAGTNAAMSFAQQILKTETLRSQNRFADIVRGLHVYGAKVVQPNAMAVLTATKA